MGLLLGAWVKREEQGRNEGKKGKLKEQAEIHILVVFVFI